jgi:hypothetical protein
LEYGSVLDNRDLTGPEVTAQRTGHIKSER